MLLGLEMRKSTWDWSSRMKNDLIWVAICSFLIGALLCFITIAATHRHHYEIIKTNIGEFIIHDGKIFTVYEMQRNVAGDMVTR
jgi:hypothetical protein